MVKVSSEQVQRIKELSSKGKSTREIAEILSLGKSTVSRHIKDDDTIRLQISIPEIETESMPIERNVANSFLSEIGIMPPLPQMDSTVPESSPLKGNPKALRLAEMLAGIGPKTPKPQRREQEPNVIVPQYSAPTALVPVVPVADSGTLIAQIQMNADHFEPVLKHLLVPDKNTFMERLYKKSREELSMVLQVIEKARLLGNLTNQFKHMFWGASSALEMGTKLVGLKTEGLEQALRLQSAEVESIIKELAMTKIDSWGGSQSPEIRLGYLVSATVLSVDTMNRVRAAREVKAPAPVTVGSAVATESDKAVRFKDL